MADEYYHASRQPLEIGTVLTSNFQPDDAAPAYGMVIASIGKLELPPIAALMQLQQPDAPALFATVLKEVVFELMRPEHLPCRINKQSVYLFSSPGDLAVFQQGQGGPHSYLCAVDGSELFSADFTLASSLDPTLPIDQHFDYLVQRARRYWSRVSNDKTIWEFLAPSGRVRVVKAL